MTFRLGVGGRAEKSAPEAIRRAADETCLSELPTDAVWIWTDGSAKGGVRRGGGGALLVQPSGETSEVTVAREPSCSRCGRR